ncbi:hypothetical protein BN59_03080 [Legionella massiliensis]|uniref:IncA protein n=1 Tax=Legionella massiliensis TaxID=1034943 RepID=A0A078L0S5_9GAMM|nr:hypothetical protein [Legionella massiliensis]CDZ78766.1 hypothetical protein BN59_03080 [Legionella massiliensis]CEE14504.1 hypothetical protein BN1094_03080 [Legionella massiliensis]
MAELPEQSVYKFNQKALKIELKAALIIQNQLQALTQDMVIHYPSDGSKALQTKIHEIAGQAINEMIRAESKEAFNAQRKRLEKLLKQLQVKLALDGDLDKALEDYRFYQQPLRILRDSSIAKKMPFDNFTKLFSNHPEYAEWKEKLEKLQNLNDDEFDNYRHSLMADLLIKQQEKDLSNLASLALIKQNLQTMSQARLSYLPEVNDRKEIFKDLAWILAGGLLLTAASVLGLAFPVLVIPGIVLGAVVLGYGIIDFSKQNAELLAEVYGEELGERALGKELADELIDFEGKFPGFEKGKFLEQQAKNTQHLSSEKKLLRGLGYSIAFAGLALGFAGLFAAIPGIGIPVAGLIAITVLAATVTLLATALWGYKVAREQEKLNTVNKEVEEQLHVDEAFVANTDLGPRKDEGLSSSAKIFLRELEAKKQGVESLENISTEVFDEDLEPSPTKQQGQKNEPKPMPDVAEDKPLVKEDDDDDSEGESPPSSTAVR